MPVFRLDERVAFPPPELAEDGLLAVGGDLRPERLLTAYSQGIFPWYEDGLPILWHSPDPRMVLRAEDLHVPRSLAKTMRRRPYQITLDSAFRDVVAACAGTARPGQEGTWITREMIEAYVVLHRLGFAHSVEAWRGDELVGGLYGVSLGAVFFGESMFSRAPDASKVALVRLVERLRAEGCRIIDCQQATGHLASLGAREIPRKEFATRVQESIQYPPIGTRWT